MPTMPTNPTPVITARVFRRIDLNDDDNDYNDDGHYSDIYGYGGNDRIDGFDGDDHIYGGTGNDHLYGGNYNDRLYGEDDDD